MSNDDRCPDCREPASLGHTADCGVAARILANLHDDEPDKVHALFFTEDGSGPDNVSLWTQPLPELRDVDTMIGARTLGLRVGTWTSKIPEVAGATLPLLFAEPGGYQMDEATVRALRDRFTAWLDAPRDAARVAAELVTRDDELVLCKTPLGEWGVYSEDEPPAEVSWFAGETAEQDARRLFAKERGKALCDNCAAEIDEDDLTEAGEDGPDVCHACATALQEEFEATRYRCVGERTADQPGCGWTGTGAEVTVADGQTFCPLCVDASEAEKVEDEQPTEAPAGG